MKLTNSISTIDTHASGEPVRIITSGIPTLHGNTMLEKMGVHGAELRLATYNDHVRTSRTQGNGGRDFNRTYNFRG